MKSKIPTIIAIIVLIFGLAAGVFLVQYQQVFRLGAAGEAAPKDVKISNLADSSLTVSWTTDKKTGGLILWGVSAKSLGKTADDEITAPAFTHSVNLSGLAESQTVYFKITSSGQTYDDSGNPWQATTGPKVLTPDSANTISGSVVDADKNPVGSTLVYVQVGQGSLLSGVTSASGNWVIPISQARTEDLSGYLTLSETQTLLKITADAGAGNVAGAEIYPQSARPAPAITLGETADFKSLPPSDLSENPNADINLPAEATPSSGFSVPDKIEAPSTQTVSLESVASGEVVTTEKPEFFGEGPAGTRLTIKVESDPMSGQVTVDKGGDWKWNPPSNLGAGAHTITISWTDASGILRTLKRTFIVQASEGPAFEATPSASPIPTATPRTSPTPTPSGSPLATPTLAPTSTPTPISTASGIPVSGTLTPTLILLIMGMSAIALSFVIWKYSRN